MKNLPNVCCQSQTACQNTKNTQSKTRGAKMKQKIITRKKRKMSRKIHKGCKTTKRDAHQNTKQAQSEENFTKQLKIWKNRHRFKNYSKQKLNDRKETHNNPREIQAEHRQRNKWTKNKLQMTQTNEKKQKKQLNVNAKQWKKKTQTKETKSWNWTQMEANWWQQNSENRFMFQSFYKSWTSCITIHLSAVCETSLEENSLHLWHLLKLGQSQHVWGQRSKPLCPVTRQFFEMTFFNFLSIWCLLLFSYVLFYVSYKYIFSFIF